MKHAIPRLKKQGWVHWYDGEFRPHKRPDVVALFDKLYNEALLHGYKVENYTKAAYIKYNKTSLKDWKYENVVK
jgi:hypothetical protein